MLSRISTPEWDTRLRNYHIHGSCSAGRIPGGQEPWGSQCELRGKVAIREC